MAVPLSGQDFSGKTVLAIEYGPQDQPLDPHDVAMMQMVKVGEPLDLNQVGNTIDQFYASGHFSDIQVDAEPRGDGVALRFIVRSKRFVGHIDTVGKLSDPPSRNLVLSDAQLALGTPFNQDVLQTAKQNILSSFKQNGLYEATVDTTTVEDPVTHQVSVTFNVKPGKRAKYEEPVIKGDTKLPDKTIIKATGWRIRFIKRWRQVTQALTDKGTDGIQHKYVQQERMTASVDVTSLDYNPDTRRVKPTIEIEAGPKVSIKALEAKVSKSRLRRYVPVYAEGSVDNDLLTEGARNLRDYFQAKGYPDVDVTFKSTKPDPDHEVINYYISAGLRRKLASVQITGADYFPEDTLHERMFLQPASFVLRRGRYSEAFRKKDEEAIENLYEANGFRDVKVTSSIQTNYKGKADALAATFHVKEGPQWRIAKLTVDGFGLLDISPIRDQLISSRGQPYSDVNIASDRNRILEYYYDHGFPTATFGWTVTPSDEPNRVVLAYHIGEGRPNFVRKVVLSGLLRTRPSVVQRDITIQPGDPLSLVRVNDISRKLSNLGIFAKINSAIQNQDGTEEYKYVLYDFDEAARYTLNFGIGAEIGQFGATTQQLNKAAGQQGFYPRFALDVNRINFLGIGQTISLQTRFSNLEQRASINYVVPRFLGSTSRTVTFSLLYDTTQDVTTFASKRQEASVQTSQKLSKPSTILLRFAYRRVSTSGVVIPSLLIPQLLQPVRIGILSASYIQDHRDNAADAHHGYWNTVDAGLAGNFFASQRNFARLLARNSTYHTVGKDIVFARQTQLGVIKPWKIAPGLNSASDVPLPERFFGGGSVSMRGFGYNQAGPRDIGAPAAPGAAATAPTGFPLGGNALLFNTFELRFPLYGPNVRGVVFHDLGNVYSTFHDISLRYHQRNEQDFNYAEQAAGFGIRYKTPLGPVRVDLAYALNPPRYFGFNGTIQELLACGTHCVSQHQQLSHFQFFFSIGQAF